MESVKFFGNLTIYAHFGTLSEIREKLLGNKKTWYLVNKYKFFCYSLRLDNIYLEEGKERCSELFRNKYYLYQQNKLYYEI